MIIVVHRIFEKEEGVYTGNVKMVDPETGEILVEKEFEFEKCNKIYACYKTFQQMLRLIGVSGYTGILLDTNVQNFGEELIGEQPNVNQTLRSYTARNMQEYGIESIDLINKEE